MKANTIGYFEIESSHPEREIGFYSALFGWTFSRENNLPIEYYRIQTGNINGGLLKRPNGIPSKESGSNAFVNSIQVENFDKTSEHILRLGGQIALPKFAVTGRCWQGYFLDADQNRFGIFEVDPDAK
jgi:uncharacterized protein